MRVLSELVAPVVDVDLAVVCVYCAVSMTAGIWIIAVQNIPGLGWNVCFRGLGFCLGHFLSEGCSLL